MPFGRWNKKRTLWVQKRRLRRRWSLKEERGTFRLWNVSTDKNMDNFFTTNDTVTRILFDRHGIARITRAILISLCIFTTTIFLVLIARRHTVTYGTCDQISYPLYSNSSEMRMRWEFVFFFFLIHHHIQVPVYPLSK